MAVGTGDVLRRAASGQALRIALTVSVVTGTAAEGEVGSPVDERFDFGIDTSVWGVLEGTAEVTVPNWSGSDQNIYQ